MVSLDGIHPGCCVASVFGLIHLAHLESPGLEGLLHIDNLHVHLIFSVDCSSAGLSSLETARMCTPSAIGVSETPAGTE